MKIQTVQKGARSALDCRSTTPLFGCTSGWVEHKGGAMALYSMAFGVVFDEGPEMGRVVIFPHGFGAFTQIDAPRTVRVEAGDISRSSTVVYQCV